MADRALRPRRPNRPQQPQPAAGPVAPNIDSGEDGDEGTIAEMPRDYTPRPDNDKTRALVAHFNNLRKEVQSAVLLLIKKMHPVSQHAGELLEQMPAPNEADALSYIPDKPDGWTDEDEAALLQEWAESSEREALTVEFEKTHPMRTMWKTWLRFLHTAPSCLISAQNGLQFHMKTEDGRPKPNWSIDFCGLLRKLASHGIFQGRVELLHLALLWVPICRQDYRGPIRWRNPTSDVLLTNLVRSMWQQDGTKTVKDLHSEVRAPYGPLGPGSFMSDLLQGIEKRAFVARPVGAEAIPVFDPESPEDIPVFDLSVADLRVVKKAANAITTLGFPAFHPMAVSWRVVANMANNGTDFPNTNEELERVRTAAALSVRRYEARPPIDDLEMQDV